MKIVALVSRILLGLIFVIFGLNFFLKFLPMPPPPEGPARDFIFAIFGSGFLLAVKVIEIVGGGLLLSGRFAPLGLTLVAPVVINILFYHAFLVHGQLVLPAVMSALSLVLLYAYRSHFAGLVRPATVTA